MPDFHPAPHDELSTYISYPQDFVNGLYRELLEARPYFPGDTNVTGLCIDSLMERLESMGATRAFDDD
jgi:hypothetical protein